MCFCLCELPVFREELRWLCAMSTREVFAISIMSKSRTCVHTHSLRRFIQYSVRLTFHVCIWQLGTKGNRTFKQEFVYLENVIENSAYWEKCGYTNTCLSKTAYSLARPHTNSIGFSKWNTCRLMMWIFGVIWFRNNLNNTAMWLHVNLALPSNNSNKLSNALHHIIYIYIISVYFLCCRKSTCHSGGNDVASPPINYELFSR